MRNQHIRLEPGAASDDIVLDEGFRFVENLQVLGRDEDVVALGKSQVEATLAGELDVQAGAVEQGQVQPHQTAKRRQTTDPRGPGGPAVALAGDVEVVRADVDARPFRPGVPEFGPCPAISKGKGDSSPIRSIPSTVSTLSTLTDPRNSVTNGVAGRS